MTILYTSNSFIKEDYYVQESDLLIYFCFNAGLDW